MTVRNVRVWEQENRSNGATIVNMTVDVDGYRFGVSSSYFKDAINSNFDPTNVILDNMIREITSTVIQQRNLRALWNIEMMQGVRAFRNAAAEAELIEMLSAQVFRDIVETDCKFDWKKEGF